MTEKNRGNLVKNLIDYFDSRGHKIVSANFGDFERPQKIKNFEPDVIAYHIDNDLYSIGHAKTCIDLEHDETREQFQEFANVTMQKIGFERNFLPFCIAVPKECIKKLEQKIQEFGLSLNGNIQPLAF